MILYIRNGNTVNDLILNDIGLIIPKNDGVNDGLVEIDTMSHNNLLRAGSGLYALLNTGTGSGDAVGFTYDVASIYVSTDGAAGSNKAVMSRSRAFSRLQGFAEAQEEFYSNAASGLAAATTQGAIDEVEGRVDAAESDISGIQGDITTLQGDVSNIQSDLTAIDGRVDTLESITGNWKWRPNAIVITEDTQFNVAGPLTIASMTFPLSDDDAGTQLTGADLVNGALVLFKGTTGGALWLSNGTTLTKQTGSAGLVVGYTWVVEKDLINSPDASEKQSVWHYDGTNLIKISDVNWNIGSTITDNATGVVYTYDQSRAKYVSILRHELLFNSAAADGKFLSFGDVTTANVGYLLKANAVITGISIMQDGGLATKSFKIIKNNNLAAPLDTVTLVASKYNNFAKNINLNAGDVLQIYADTSGAAAKSIVATIEYGYRQ
jgi:hypothetical protein